MNGVTRLSSAAGRVRGIALRCYRRPWSTRCGSISRGCARCTRKLISMAPAVWVLPDALERKYPHAASEWGWQFGLPAARICRGSALGSTIAVSSARVGGAKGGRPAICVAERVGPHTFRHSFADASAGKMATTFVLVQKLLGHKDVSTTMIYTHVLSRGALGVRSPADRLTLVGRRP